MYESYTVWIAGLLLAGQESTVDDGAVAVLLSVALLLITTLWGPSRVLRRARRVTAGHLAAVVSAACFSLGSVYTLEALALALGGVLSLEPAWKSPSSRSLVVAVDTELLLLVAVSIEAGPAPVPLRIAAATVSGLALASFIATAWLDPKWHENLSRGLRGAGIGLIAATDIVNGELSGLQNAASTAALGWFLLPPTS